MFCFRSCVSIFLAQLIYLVSENNSSIPFSFFNLQCRDNNDKPVEWWYIYKLPSDDVLFLELGSNFTYISSDRSGRWRPSNRSITSNSMLQHTLSPIYLPSYLHRIALVIYESDSSSAARGVLIADANGGVWISHTVPGLINLNDDHHKFPEKEMNNGHLLMCISIDLLAVNKIVSAVKRVEPTLSYVKIPENLKGVLPMWNFSMNNMEREKGVQRTECLTSKKSLDIEILSRPPNDRECLYEHFAASKRIVLNIYSPAQPLRLSDGCSRNSSIRDINGISLKLREWVHYIDRGRDKSMFAVSTGAPWQKLRSWPPQYWTCISNLDTRKSTRKGGLIACVNDFGIWRAFDSLKIKEPEC